jgi:small subunit ribosomal protein S4
LQEKQKAKYTYGILERQFANMFDKASRSKGKTGDVLLQLCESRLDNVVLRLGLGKTRDAARQLVGHRHITLNGELASIPSINVKPGDVIGVREKSKSLVVIGDSLASKSADHPWIEWNESKMEGTFLSVPSRDAIPENIKEQLIVELYSK